MVDRSENAFEENKPGTNARTEAEAAIKSLRGKGGVFVEAVRATRMPMALTDPNLPGNPIVFANEAFLKLSGYSMEEVLGQKPHFMNGSGTDPRDVAHFEETLRSEQDDLVETVQYRKDGSRFVATVLLSAFKDDEGQVLNHFMSWLDVTRRVEAENKVAELNAAHAALGDSSQRLAASLDSLGAETALRESETRRRLLQTVWEANADGVVISDSPSWRAYTGQTVEEWLGDGWLDAVHPEDRAFAERQWREAVAARKVADAEFRLRTSNGGWRWTNVRAAPVLDADGKVEKWAGMNIDIDARKRAEEALRESEEQLRLIVESATDYAIFTMDNDRRITTWLAGAQKVFGWTPEEAVGQLVDMTFTPEDRAEGVPANEAEGARRNGSAPNVRWHVCKDGRRVFIDGHTIALRNDKGEVEGFLKIGQDTTDKHRASEMQSTLLAELQHRVRNILAVIRSLARRTGDTTETREEFLQHFDGRLTAMARLQMMLTRRPEAEVNLQDLLLEEIEAQSLEEKRFRMSGPEVELSSKAAEVLSLAIHELATNSIKYGALSDLQGSIEVEWKIVDEAGAPWIEFQWTEPFTDDSERTRREGFGTELVTQRVPYELRGEGRMEVGPERILTSIRFPIENQRSMLEP